MPVKGSGSAGSAEGNRALPEKVTKIMNEAFQKANDWLKTLQKTLKRLKAKETRKVTMEAQVVANRVAVLEDVEIDLTNAKNAYWVHS